MVLAAWQAKVAAGDLADDPVQAAAAARLDQLASELEAAPEPRSTVRGAGFWRLLGRGSPPPAVTAPRGVYIHGDVGRGKSMLMDLFFAQAQLDAKRRVHFHAFMLEVHGRLHALRQEGAATDPLRPVAEELAKHVRLLCFDEFHVVDIADAMILGRLFTGLFAAGVTVVATSNWPPRRLYEGGLNRDRFLPFIDLLRRHVDVVALDGPVDYRLKALREVAVYHTPPGAEADAALGRVLEVLSEGEEPAPVTINVGSRTLEVAKAAGGVAWLTFAELCARPLGAADYLALTDRFHSLILTGVPTLSPGRRNEARRFMTLVDALYERHTMLFVSAEVPPEALYPEGDGAFEFRRTVSRLTEMQSRPYLERCRARAHLPKGEFIPFALTTDLT